MLNVTYLNIVGIHSLQTQENFIGKTIYQNALCKVVILA